MNSFRPVRRFGTLACAGLLALPATSSDLVGVYAVVDRVVMSPDSVSPRTIQIFGVFATSTMQPGNDYNIAARGYMYYQLDQRNIAASRAEWADLRGIAGTGRAISYGSRSVNPGRVRPMREQASTPDTYPISTGLTRMPLIRGSEQGSLALYVFSPRSARAVEDVLSVPDTGSPADGGSVAAGQVHLVARSVADTTLDYMFDITGPDGRAEASARISRGGDSTVFSPRLSLTSGATYTWRVWTVRSGFTGPPATATFTVNRR